MTHDAATTQARPEGEAPRLDPGWRESEADVAGFDPAALVSSIEAATQRADTSMLDRLRAGATGSRIAWASMLALALAFGAAHDGAHAPWHGRASVGECVEILVWSLAVVATLALALRPLHRPALPRGTVAGVVAGMITLAFVLALVGAKDAVEPTFGPALPPALVGGVPCLVYGTMLAIPTYLLARALDRGHGASRWFAASAGALVGNLSLAMHCGTDDVGHHLAGHASLGVILIACLAVATAWERHAATR